MFQKTSPVRGVQPSTMAGNPNPWTWMSQQSQTPSKQNTARDRFLLLDHPRHEAVAPRNRAFTIIHIPGEGISAAYKSGPAVSAVNAAELLSDQCRPTGPTPDFLLSASWARATGREDFIDGIRSMATHRSQQLSWEARRRTSEKLHCTLDTAILYWEVGISLLTLL